MLLAEFLDLYGMINSSLNEILAQLWPFWDLMDLKTYVLLSLGIGRPDSTLQSLCTGIISNMLQHQGHVIIGGDLPFSNFYCCFYWHSYGFAEENAMRRVVFILKDLRLRSLFEPQETGGHPLAMTSLVIW